MTRPFVKIGVISDIHGNLLRLQRALDLLRAMEVDHIVCAGDLVDKGDAPDEVVEIIRTQNIPCVQGNHDFDALHYHQWAKQFGTDSLTTSLKDETIALLAALPQTLRFEWKGVKVLMAHGTPWSRDTYLFSISFLKAFKRVAEEAQADVVILGHTHSPMIVDVQGKCLIVNPGALHGGYFDDKHTCGLLSLPDMNFMVYDVDSGQTVEPEHVRIRLTDR